MIIDLHVHEELFSPCSFMSLEEAATAARDLGLDALCITNHDSLDIARNKDLQRMPLPVFVGVEMSTLEGDMLAFGLESLPARHPTAQEFIDFVASQNGFACAAHPFRAWGGVGSCLGALRGLQGVEVLNGANDAVENGQAFKACKQLQLVALGGSDAHRSLDVGRCATWFPEQVQSMGELIQALQSGRCRPVIRHTDGKYRIWEDPVLPAQDTPYSWLRKMLGKLFSQSRPPGGKER